MISHHNRKNTPERGKRSDMLMGQYEHSIDPKNRINFPARFREQLG